MKMIWRSVQFLALFSLIFCQSALAKDTWTFTDAFGDQVEVPKRPQRVLALSEVDLDAMLALDFKPVGTTNGRGQNTPPRYLGDKAAGVPVLGNLGRPSMDKIIEADPDLILMGGVWNRDILVQLREIAPTVVTFKIGENWDTSFLRVAKVLNQEAQAHQFLMNYHKKVSQVQAKLGGKSDLEVSVVRWNPKGPGYMLKDSFSTLVLNDLKLQQPLSQQQKGVAHSPILSLEALHRIDADLIFLGTLSSKGKAVDAMGAAKKIPAFQQLKAVKNNRLIEVDGSLWTSLGGPLAAMAIVEKIESSLRQF